MTRYIVSSTAGVVARRGPGTSFDRVKYGTGARRGRVVVRPLGWGFSPTQTKRDANGLLWGMGSEYWYCLEYFRRFSSKPPAAERPSSPVPGYGVNYPYGVRNSRYKAGKHTGEDHAAPVGARIVSLDDGVVVRADWGGAYGNWTIVRGEDHTGKIRERIYCHQSRRAVRVGQKVKCGQTIGYVGATGMITGSHLHHEKSSGSRWAYAAVVAPSW